MIEQINDYTFKVVSRGSEMTLVKERDEWVMYTVNAMVKVYNNGFAIPKYFPTLKDVEKKYKSWRGISSLLDSNI